MRCGTRYRLHRVVIRYAFSFPRLILICYVTFTLYRYDLHFIWCRLVGYTLVGWFGLFVTTTFTFEFDLRLRTCLYSVVGQLYTPRTRRLRLRSATRCWRLVAAAVTGYDLVVGYVWTWRYLLTFIAGSRWWTLVGSGGLRLVVASSPLPTLQVTHVTTLPVVKLR